MNTSVDSTWSLIWKLKVSQKIQMFVWLLYHGKILTNEERMRRRMTDDPRCHCCRDKIEGLDHLFHACRDARLIWDKLLNEGAKKRYMGLPFREWIRWDLKLDLLNEEMPWKELFVICLWWIWRWRNDEVYNAKQLDLGRKLAMVKSRFHEIIVNENKASSIGVWRNPRMAWVG